MNRPLPWYQAFNFRAGAVLQAPLYRLVARFPQWERGLSDFSIHHLVQSFAGLQGRRAVHLTDLHLDRYLPRHERILDTIGPLSPEWIFVTGDLLNVPSGLPHLFRFLGELRTLAPVYVTLGNHDHYSGVPLGQFIDWSDRHKIHLLVNQVTFVQFPHAELAIVGLDDPATHRANLSCIPAPKPNRFTVVLAHAPNVVDLFDDHHAGDLILCGHSHGGQWRPGRMRPFWLPYGCNGRVDGLHVCKGRRLYVNRGIGWSTLPLRWNCRPEIVVVDWI